jgi:peroxiredoxin
MSGTFVIDRDGTLLLAHRDEHPNDHASMSDVLGCLDAIA